LYDSAKKYLSILLLGFWRVLPQKLPKGLEIFIIYAFKSAGNTAPDFWRLQKMRNAQVKPASFIY